MPKAKNTLKGATAVDLFCGAGGLTRGLLDAGIEVVAGYDIDEACRYPFETNNRGATFHQESVSELTGKSLANHYPAGDVRILVGCAPCVTFSRYTQGLNRRANPKWSLLNEFARLVRELKPDVVSIENVPELQKESIFADFIETLEDEGFHFSKNPAERVLYCPDYGLPQHRSRLVLLASRFGPIEIVPPTHRPGEHRTVRDAISRLPFLKAGEKDADDSLHRASKLSSLNLKRIRHSRPGGTWNDWPDELVAQCHKDETGKSYAGVYGRMDWDKPAPTITTQFFGFGSGRFGHPKQDRALSLREGAILQSFPKSYAFAKPGSDYSMRAVGRMIGNAVPVRLGKAIGRSIKAHLKEHGH